MVLMDDMLVLMLGGLLNREVACELREVLGTLYTEETSDSKPTSEFDNVCFSGKRAFTSVNKSAGLMTR